MRFFLLFLLVFSSLTSRLPDLSKKDVTNEFREIMKMHASVKSFSPALVKKMLSNFIEELDPIKSYFIESDIDMWIHPSDELLTRIETQVQNGDFTEFEKIQAQMVKAIERRHVLESELKNAELPKNVKAKEFKDLEWTKTPEELADRLQKIRALQATAASKLSEDLKEKSLLRIKKKQDKFDEEILNPDPTHKERFIFSAIMKAFASSLDSHTAYFTPDEAQQFMIGVQQRLYGIGAQLRDDISGFTITKVIEGGPAANSKEIKLKDKIIAVNGEPVVGMDIIDAVELIRGEEQTPVTLTLIREIPSDKPGESREEKLDVTLIRSEVKLKESRYESSVEPYGDGAIAYLRLFSFYQDSANSSAEDLALALKKIKSEHNLKGVILDLRYNSGGLLTQAVQVAGLFMTKGIVVSIKDETGDLQHLRELDSKMEWDGPLIILINRASASASEIVAQALQDYGRALIVGDDHSYGKGSFQTFTLNASKSDQVNPKGEYKVTRGRYYTVSGKTPQLSGVQSDIVVPGILSEMEIGEKFTKAPLEGDQIKDNYNDDLLDIPFYQRDRLRALYKFDLQQKLSTYAPYHPILVKNSSYRISNDKNYQAFLKEIKKEESEEEAEEEELGKIDLQLLETYNVMKDLILLQKKS
jgi:carboxyl-terminal processing protease